MWEIDATIDAINAYLEQIRLLKAQPQINDVAIDNIMWKVLGLAIKLDELYEEIYRDELSKLETEETITIRDELLKRERILELSRVRQNVLSNLFNTSNKEEKELYDLFEDIRRKQEYEAVFHASDVRLVKEQLDLVEENKQKEQLLKEEYSNNLLKLNELESKIMSFEDFNNKLNEEYERFIAINEIDDIDINAATIAKMVALERQAIIKENKELLKTAQNIDVSQFKYLDERYENDKIIIEESNELLFMVDLSNLMRSKVDNYEQLKNKVATIEQFVETRENDFLRKYPNINYPNDFSYRTIFFKNDVSLVEEQLNATKNIELLGKRNNEIEYELENLYENVKGRRELNEIIYNEDPKENQLEDSLELQEETPVKEETQAYKVKKVEKASSLLLEKVKAVKDKLLTLANRSAPFILSGAILLAPLLNKKVVNDKHLDYIEPIIETEDELASSPDEIMALLNELEEETVTNSIGDKVNIEKGTKYYRDATSAQLDNNSYEAGHGSYGLRPENYNVNRIAIMEKDMLGNATGKILAINSTPGVSAEELARSLGLEADQYEVMIHIGSGDENGNYIEAPTNSKSSDDLCWMRADSPGIKIVTPAEEVLSNQGKGIVR